MKLLQAPLPDFSCGLAQGNHNFSVFKAFRAGGPLPRGSSMWLHDGAARGLSPLPRGPCHRVARGSHSTVAGFGPSPLSERLRQGL